MEVKCVDCMTGMTLGAKGQEYVGDGNVRSTYQCPGCYRAIEIIQKDADDLSEGSQPTS